MSRPDLLTGAIGISAAYRTFFEPALVNRIGFKAVAGLGFVGKDEYLHVQGSAIGSSESPDNEEDGAEAECPERDPDEGELDPGQDRYGRNG